jgi:subtilisin family serine protease
MTKKNEMKRKKARCNFWTVLLPLVVAAVFFIPQCSYETAQASASRAVNNTDTPLRGDFSPENVLVVMNKEASRKFKVYTQEDFPEIRCDRIEDLTEPMMDLVRRQLEAEKSGNWDGLKSHIESNMLMDVEKFRRVLCLTLTEKGKENVLKTIRQIERSDDVLCAGPDYILSICKSPNDLHNGQKWAADKIYLPSAWDITTGYAGVKVGVLDTGINATHRDLADRVDISSSGNFMVNPTVWGTSVDDYPGGHGTFVAGIIGAEGNNGFGVTGVCWDVTLVSLKVLNDKGIGLSSYTARAIAEASSEGIPILNLSGRWFLSSTGLSAYDEPLTAVINAYSGLLVCSAGNENRDINIGQKPCYPASYNLDNLITVGATDSNDDLWYKNNLEGSNYGSSSVDLFAPGAGIYSTDNNGSFDYDSGTSFATPFVTGVAALLKSMKPELSAQELKARILDNVDKFGNLSNKCVSGGRLNAYRAVTNNSLAGSIDINFNGKGLIGKLYVFSDGTTVVAERGVDSSPVPYDPPNSPYPFNHRIEWGTIPSKVEDYLDNGTINANFILWVPASTSTGNSYNWYWGGAYITKTGKETYISVDRYYIYEYLLPSDIRKIRVTPYVPLRH